MATFNPRRFCKPDTLGSIDTANLKSFLAPFDDYMKERGVDLSSQPFDYPKLSEVLLSPGTDTPPELAESLYYVDELSTQQGFDQILEEIENTPLAAKVGQCPTYADLAVEVWLENPRIIERLHASQLLSKPRSFTYAITTGEIRDFIDLDRSGLELLHWDLNEWFAKKKRGKSAKVFVYKEKDFIWFTVRHGEPFTRQPSLKNNNEEGSEYFRPIKHDLLIYNPSIGELRINAKTKGERELYRLQFGKHFFGDMFYFDSNSKFTLSPICEYGRDCLVCSDIEGVEYIKLKELQINHGGDNKEIEIRKAEDVFSVYEDRAMKLPSRETIAKAGFTVKFIDSKTTRTVTITPTKAQYKRDDDSQVLEQWFAARGFLLDAS
jgi:hypothetical protein